MGDETEFQMPNNSEGNSNVNQDELILAQQRQIEKEVYQCLYLKNNFEKFYQISENISLVGDLEPITSLNSEYSTDLIYLEKVKDLASKYKYIRRTRPDGNCFFRAFSYANIERLLEDKDQFNEFYKSAEDSKNGLVQLGFQKLTVEDFYDTVCIL